MRTHKIGWATLLIVLVLTLPACREQAAEEEAGGADLATVEPVEGTDVAQVTLTAEAAERIDVQTTAVERAPGHADLTIPYAAVLYDPDGDTWTYTSPETLVFIRAPIEVVRIEGDRAILSDGPAPGTEVVTVGAAELLGTEYEVGEE
jgi:hypothetical protein